MASFPEQVGSRYQKSKTGTGFKWSKRWWDCWMAVALAGPYANILHLTQTDNHTNTSSLNFYRPNALPDTKPTVSKHWSTFLLIFKKVHLDYIKDCDERIGMTDVGFRTVYERWCQWFIRLRRWSSCWESAAVWMQEASAHSIAGCQTT